MSGAATEIPAIVELASLGDRFVNWRLEPGVNGKPTKVPYRPLVGQAVRASATRPVDWDTYDAATAATVAGSFDGIGFVPRPAEDGIFVIDLDGCVSPETGEIAQWASDIVEHIDSYAELSPSGTGLKIYARAPRELCFPVKAIPIRDAPKFSEKDPAIEILTEGRYTTVSSSHLGGTPQQITYAGGYLANLARWMAEDRASVERKHRPSVPTPWTKELLLRAADVIPNLDLPWQEWNNVVMRFWAATYGSDEGLTACDIYSRKSKKYDPSETAARWRGITNSRPTRYDVNSLFKEARKFDPGFPDPAHLVNGVDFSELLKKAAAGGERVRVEEIVTPEPREEPAPLRWDGPAFYGPLGDLVRTVEPLTEASPIGLLASLVTMTGNWLGREFYVPIGADHHVPALYALLIGPSSTGRKGTAVGIARCCMSALDPDWAEHNVFRAINSGQGIVQAVQNLSLKASERSGNGAGDKRAMFVIPEFGDVLAKTSLAGNTILETLRDVWDDGALENNSVTRPTRVRGATVSMLGMVTGEELTERLELRELATGSLNRVLLIQVNRSKVLPGNPPTITPALIADAVEQLRHNVEHVRNQARGNLAGCLPKPVALSPAADKLAIDIKAASETDGATWIEKGNARAYVQTMRIALVHAVTSGSSTLEPEHLQAAAALVDYAAKGIASLATGELKNVLAQRILSHMREDPGEALTRTAINSDIFQKHVSARDLETAIRELERLGLLKSEVQRTQGRPRTVYRLAK